MDRKAISTLLLILLISSTDCATNDSPRSLADAKFITTPSLYELQDSDRVVIDCEVTGIAFQSGYRNENYRIQLVSDGESVIAELQSYTISPQREIIKTPVRMILTRTDKHRLQRYLDVCRRVSGGTSKLKKVMTITWTGNIDYFEEIDDVHAMEYGVPEVMTFSELIDRFRLSQSRLLENTDVPPR